MTLPLVKSDTTIFWPLQFIALMLTHTYLHEGSSWKFEIPINYYIAIKTITDGTPWSISFYLKWSSLQKWQKSFKYPHPYIFSYFALLVFRWPCLLDFWNWIWKELDTDQHKKVVRQYSISKVWQIILQKSWLEKIFKRFGIYIMVFCLNHKLDNMLVYSIAREC